MRRLTWIALGTAFVVVGSAAAVAQQQFVFFASIADSTGAPVTALAPDDLKIVENGAEGKVVKIEPIDWPIRLQILVDNGTGMGEALVQIRNGLKGLVMPSTTSANCHM